MATKTPASKTAAKKPAARKTPARKSAANRWATIQLPEGYTPITTGEFGEPWDYEETPMIVGTVTGAVRDMEVGKGRDKRNARVVTILNDTDGRTFDVWDSAALRAFFDKLEEGMQVSVIFQGYRDTGKASPMKVFVGAISNEYVEQTKKPAGKAAVKKTTKR